LVDFGVDTDTVLASFTDLKALAEQSRRVLDEKRLWQDLARRLPGYMLPSRLVVMDELPVTPNGKVNRRALPAPEAPSRVEIYVAPRTTQEEELCSIWGEVLKLDRVGVNDNFFRLGGHSLLLMQLMARVRSVFGVTLSLRELFEAPTVHAMAERICRQQSAAA